MVAEYLDFIRAMDSLAEKWNDAKTFDALQAMAVVTNVAN